MILASRMGAGNNISSTEIHRVGYSTIMSGAPYHQLLPPSTKHSKEIIKSLQNLNQQNKLPTKIAIEIGSINHTD